MDNYDVTVIGGGPGGYVAAIRCAQLGLKTLIIEKEHLGGICLNWGCIPTKSLLKSAELYYKMKHHSEEYGISLKDVKFDLSKIVSRSRDISTKLTTGIKGLLKKNKVTILEGKASLVDNNTVAVRKEDSKETQTIKTKNIIIATGAKARVIDGFKPNGSNIWTYREALVPKELPKSMIVVGSGAIGIEFASFYNALGTKVTVLEAADTILPVEDKEISAIAKKSFEGHGISFMTSVKLLKQVNIGG
jgi:dihydrolipoamide dehydrogenase